MFALVLLLGCRPSVTAADVLERPEVQVRVAMTTLLGREIYRREKMRWWAAQQAALALQPGDFDSVAGWVVDVDNPDTDVLFFDDADQVVLVVHCSGAGLDGCVAEAPSSPMLLSKRNRAQYDAINTVAAHPPIADRTKLYNPVVIPAGTSADVDWWVYMVRVHFDPSEARRDKHYRFVVDATGQTVESSISFSEAMAGGQKMAMSFLSDAHEIPTEMNVYAAMHAGKPFVVAIETDSKARKSRPTLWLIDIEGNISPFE